TSTRRWGRGVAWTILLAWGARDSDSNSDGPTPTPEPDPRGYRGPPARRPARTLNPATSSPTVGRRFVAQRRRDPYYRAARREGLRSRAAFKLAHLAGHHPIFRPGDLLLDLCAAPARWAVVAAEIVGARGSVVAVDLRSIDLIERVRIVRGRVGDARL